MLSLDKPIRSVIGTIKNHDVEHVGRGFTERHMFLSDRAANGVFFRPVLRVFAAAFHMKVAT